MTRHPGIETFLLEAGLVVAWSSGFIGGRLAADTPSVFLVLFWRFVVVALVLGPFVVLALRRGLSARAVAFQALLGILAMFAFLALGIKAIDLGVPIGTAALISVLQPLATAVLAGPILDEHVRPRQWAGLLLGLAGVSLAVGGGLGTAPLWAYGLSLAATASLVIGTLVAKAAASPTPLIPALGIQGAVSALLFAPLAAMDGTLVPPLDSAFAAAVLWFIVFSTLGGYGLYWLCLRRTTATRVGSLLYLTPPVTMVWGWAMFGEPLRPLAMIGLAVCLLGVVLASGRADVRRA